MVKVDLRDPKIIGLLSKPLLLRLATVSGDCIPHVSSVWFLFDGGFFWVSTSVDRLKVKNIMKNPRVALIVDTDTQPYEGVIVEGLAELVHEGVRDVTRRIVEKYVPKNQWSHTFDELMRYPRVLIRIRPSKVLDIMSYRRL
ncbi:hypothetical protein B9Q09_03140 [Candidatus Marsarchaeota G2 archaeon ECH_B_SAG-C16]|jgi:PPOX class probable F420-dependent enzyme|uniref:Pyridoxamine 5'-phosphate oxidase N-terminal domain-containing protein n=5 Tax=Candidatus Marsarchaeota group 2 TaxID=2203771 RepID=A0A2R6B3K3_9ARCH|nr:MAG: hypothetical protein B9Q06_12525 [Candidatus Marsarchaeota G2 archaeon ECH_B_2]PSN95365.1 MAG: hypothetical protein B9Q09_03140 [Candidatus Marsarchaeota G2 archaeon ECH_B_SAG-C16]PSN97534.1 MAG: hypothetical protein B9Q07_11910 [Candidatus Marsarchaeota G2 archaeon ECH_B_3]PSN98876.1 MAG: hypothetical protein B9Q05_12355 [Candidatus Marsarchaeota G2 archaeon ECH_B_1]